MKKIILGVFGVVGLGVVGVAVAASMQPDQIHLERTITVEAAPRDMAPFAEDLQKVNEWSPWEKRDPDLVPTYSEQTDVLGATYEWQSEVVGHGIQTIKSIEPGKVVHELEFIEPFAGKADATIAYARAGNELEVTWSYDQSADFMAKVMTTFMDMDEALGPDFEEGLSLLKPLVEQAAADRRAAEKKADDEATAKVMAEAEAAQAEGEGETGGENDPETE